MKKLQVLIPSYRRPHLLLAPALFDRTRYKVTVIVHNRIEADAYLKAKAIPARELEVADVPPGVALIRQWALENLIAEDEWYVSADDKIESINIVPQPYFKQKRLSGEARHLRNLFSVQAQPKMRDHLLNELINEGEKRGARYCGLANVDNYYFRLRKFREVAYVIGKFFCAKRDCTVGYDPKVKAMDDQDFTAQNLLSFGRVLVNSFAYANGKNYLPGGIGTFDERLNHKISDVAYLLEKYPCLFRRKSRANSHPLAEIQLRYHSVAQIDNWRKSLLNI